MPTESMSTESKTDGNRITCNEQRNCCVSLIQKEKIPICVVLKYVKEK